MSKKLVNENISSENTPDKKMSEDAKIRPATIVSLGGNVIIHRTESGTIKEQFDNTAAACRQIVHLAKRGHRVIVTHGNGPIVGNILLRNEAASNTVPPMPLYICDADSEGGIGFMIQQSLYNEFVKSHDVTDVATVVTQVVVDSDDPAFENPEKPIGPFYSENEAVRLSGEKGWHMKEDSGRGWRRHVASPRPVRIVEAGVIKKLVESGTVVIAVGGGGVPVLEAADGTLKGVDAVIDKDFATSALARELEAKLFINLTQIDSVRLDFNKPNEKPIDQMTVKEAKKYMAEGHFLAGSMGPKVAAAIEFIEDGGKEVIITTPECIDRAMDGKAGTRITR